MWVPSRNLLHRTVALKFQDKLPFCRYFPYFVDLSTRILCHVGFFKPTTLIQFHNCTNSSYKRSFRLLTVYTNNKLVTKSKSLQLYVAHSVADLNKGAAFVTDNSSKRHSYQTFHENVQIWPIPIITTLDTFLSLPKTTRRPNFSTETLLAMEP